MRVPMRSFRETNSALYVLILVYIPVCDQQYRAPTISSIHSSSSANIRNIIVSRDSALACTHTGVPVCDWQYRAPNTSSIHSSSSATDTCCRNMTVSATSCIVSTNTAFFLILFRVVYSYIASLRACVLPCLADLPHGSACGQATRWL